MSVTPLVVLGIAAALSAAGASAQFVKGNEAVKPMADGSRKVETPPIPGAGLVTPCPAEKPSCIGSGWRMVETAGGIQECTEIYARPGTCRASTYGIEKRARLWIAKKNGQWVQCPRPTLDGRCVSTRSLPSPEVQ